MLPGEFNPCCDPCIAYLARHQLMAFRNCSILALLFVTLANKVAFPIIQKWQIGCCWECPTLKLDGRANIHHGAIVNQQL